MMTSHTDIANRVEVLEAGADDLLFKPVDTAELIARVNAGMRLHQLTQALKSQNSSPRSRASRSRSLCCLSSPCRQNCLSGFC